MKIGNTIIHFQKGPSKFPALLALSSFVAEYKLPQDYSFHHHKWVDTAVLMTLFRKCTTKFDKWPIN